MTQTQKPQLAMPEFIALMAMLSAVVAFSIDAMLPAMSEIAGELAPTDPNRAQLILTSFILGMGLGTFFAGPLSDSFGRRNVIFFGVLLYCVGAAMAWAGNSLEAVLMGRMVQGLGAAAPRIASIALVRDLHAGRQMARIMSFVMMIFTIIPAMAPLIGSWIIDLTGWRGIFLAFIVFALLVLAWFMARQPETLAVEARTPFRAGPLFKSAAEVLKLRVAQISILMQAMLLGALFAMLSQIHSLFAETFGRADSFPYWFAAIALISGSASLINAQLVVRLGMRRLLQLALIGQLLISVGVSLTMPLLGIDSIAAFALFLFWVCGIFFTVGFTLGNVNAIAMEPLGHIAGMAASIIAAFATVLAVVVAVPVGMAFNGTLTPLSTSIALLAAATLVVMRFLPKAPIR